MIHFPGIPGSAIDLGNPVADVALNESLSAWYLYTPGASGRGGGRLLDLCGKNHGTLGSGVTWTGGCGFGWGALDFGNSTSVTVSSLANTFGGHTNVSYSCWIRPTVLANSSNLMTVGLAFNISYNNLGRISLSARGASATASFQSTDLLLSAGSWSHVVGVIDAANNSHAIYIDGRITNGTSTTATGALDSANDNSFTIGSGVGLSAKMNSCRVYLGRSLSAADVAALYDEERRLWHSTLNRIRLPVYAQAAAGGTTVTPTTASLTLTTFAPTVSAPRLVTPATASLTLTTFAPVIKTSVIPGTAALTLTTFAPTVSTPVVATPTTLAHTLTTFAPTVTATGNITATPPTAALTLTTFAPTIGGSQAATPTTAALTLSTFAPTVSTPRAVVPSTASLSLATFAPTIQTPVVCTPSKLSLSLATFAPTVTEGGGATITGQWGRVLHLHAGKTLSLHTGELLELEG